MSDALPTETESPQFEHDCENCQFLGRSAANHADLYFCRNNHGGGGLVARYSDVGSDYHSCVAGSMACEYYPALMEAGRLAMRKGLI